MTLEEIEKRILLIQNEVQVTSNNLMMLHGSLQENLEWRKKLLAAKESEENEQKLD